jgi:hypothetical protein
MFVIAVDKLISLAFLSELKKKEKEIFEIRQDIWDCLQTHQIEPLELCIDQDCVFDRIDKLFKILTKKDLIQLDLKRKELKK